MSKIIYKITPDVNQYRTIFPDNEKIQEPDLWKPDGHSKEATLLNFQAHFNTETNTPIGDIAAINMLGIALHEKVANELAALFEASGELLPFYVDGDAWYYFNVTRTLEGFLDTEKSTFMVPGLNIGLQKAVFKEEQLPQRSCIFKVPEDRFEGTYVLDSRDGDSDIMNNLFCAVQSYGYKGLKFEEVARFE